MNCQRIFLCGSVLLTLAACSIGRPIPQATTYLVDPPGETRFASTMRRPEGLRIGHVRVASAYAGSALVYRLDDVRYASDPYHAFVCDPGAMLGNRIAEWLDRNGPFGAVAPPESAQSAPFVLEATIDELYGDFRAGAAPAAVLVVQFSLIERDGPRPQVIYQRTIDSRVKLPTASADALVRGYGTALAEVLSQLAPELGAQVAQRVD